MPSKQQSDARIRWRLKHYSAAGRVAGFPSHRKVATRRGILGLADSRLSSTLNHFRCSCLNLFANPTSGIDRMEFARFSVECEPSPTDLTMKFSARPSVFSAVDWRKG